MHVPPSTGTCPIPSPSAISWRSWPGSISAAPCTPSAYTRQYLRVLAGNHQRGLEQATMPPRAPSGPPKKKWRGLERAPPAHAPSHAGSRLRHGGVLSRARPVPAERAPPAHAPLHAGSRLCHGGVLSGARPVHAGARLRHGGVLSRARPVPARASTSVEAPRSHRCAGTCC